MRKGHSLSVLLLGVFFVIFVPSIQAAPPGRDTPIVTDSKNKVPISYFIDTIPGLPYDDFHETYINKDKWNQGEFVREIDVANHRLVNKLATPSPIVIETYPYKSTNDLIFYNPQSINSIQADVSILGKAVTNDGTVKATIGGRWYYYYVSELAGYIWAEIAIKEDSSGLKATWSVLSSLDPYYSVWETLGSGDFTTTIGVSTTHTLSIGYDVDAHQFRFRVGTEEQIFGPAGLPDREGTGLDVLKFLLTEAEVGDSTSSAYIFATFANVYVNDSLYEDFSSVPLGPTKWLIQHLTIDGNSDEFVREISGGSFRSKIRSRLSTTHVYNWLEFVDPSSINLVQARVTPLQYQNEDNQGAKVEAGIAGHFFNEGASSLDSAGEVEANTWIGGNLTGEVEAKIWIGGNWNGGGAIPAAHWWVRKFLDVSGTFSQILDQGTFSMPITLGDTYVLFLGWKGEQLVFRVEDTVTEAFEEKTYVPGTSTNLPNIPWKGIGTFVYNITNLDATIEALFDDVTVSCNDPWIDIHPQSQIIPGGEAATLSVGASGMAPLAYQWYRGQSGDTSTPVGINSSSYTTPPLTQTTNYWVRVWSQGCGYSDSIAAIITVNGIYVTSPNGGETLTAGSTQTIRWSYGGNPGYLVRIQLFKGGTLDRTIVSTYAGSGGSGSYNWSIPSTQVSGSDYQIRVTSTANAAYTDTSDGNFTIVGLPRPTVSVTSPNGGETLTAGSARTIQWSYGGNPGSYAKIELLKGGVVTKVISNLARIGTGGSGSYNWLIPSNQTPGSDYGIRITSRTYGYCTDTSDSNFTVVAPSVTLTSPNGGENWAPGTTQTIQWTFTGGPGTYLKIELLKSGILNRTITSFALTTRGSYSWKIPATQAPGADYSIRITSRTNPSWTDTAIWTLRSAHKRIARRRVLPENL
jgi:hypothetical protein